MERLCVELWGIFPEGMQKRDLVSAVKLNRQDEAARTAANMGLKKDSLLAIIYAALVVPINEDYGVTTVEDFV